MRRISFVCFFVVLFFASGCSFFCRIPDEVKRSEELQYKQSMRINTYLQEINRNPAILTDPNYEKLNLSILDASEEMAESTKAMSDYLGHTPGFKEEIEKFEKTIRGGDKNGR